MTDSTPNYDFHPLAEIFPLVEKDELRELANDIQRLGLREPIVLFEGKILDGRNRYRAAKLIKYPLAEAHFKPLPSGVDPLAFVISANIHRRHLTPEQRRGIIATLLKADPTKSDRQVADQAKVDHKTVGAERGKLEATGEIPQLENTTGADGKTRKRKPKGKGSGGAKSEKEKITYQKVVNAKTALNAYGVLEEHLLDALADVGDKSDFSQAEDCARRTIEKLEERLGELQPETEAEAA
jgi:hypothetical protein